MCLGVVAILLLNSMDVFSVGGGGLFDRLSSNDCAYCACDHSVHLSVPSIGFVCVLYDGSYFLIQEFESWITGVCSLYVVSLCDLAYYVVG